MHIDPPSAMHYPVQEKILKYPLSSNVASIAKLDKQLFLGRSNLFEYDPSTNVMMLSSPFQRLLKLLIKLGALDSGALDAESLSSLNACLQKYQQYPNDPTAKKGLMRPPGMERWQLNDTPALAEHRDTLNTYFTDLGFVSSQSLQEQMTVDHCLIFGARVERMETRICDTLSYLKKNLQVAGHIFLLGSYRKLVDSEIEFLRLKLEKLEESQRNSWKEVFVKDSEYCTEGNAFMFLWECLAPQDMQASLKDKVVGIKSTRIGSSYNEQDGHRATTTVTIEDWLPYYTAEKNQTFFAVAEQPYIRLTDQLRFTVLTNGKKITEQNALISRIKNTAFYFAFPAPSVQPLISVILDEIGRNVYQTVEALKYLESLEG